MWKNVQQYGIGGALMLASGAVLAEVPTEVSSELSTLKTDALTVAGLVLAALVAVYAFKFMRKGL